MPRPQLSPRARDLVLAVGRLTERLGYPPSTVELAEELGVHPSRAAVLIKAAAARGAIERQPRLARAIRVIGDHQEKKR